MNAMSSHPVDWSTFESQRAANSQQILDQLRHSVTAMREETVIAHADADASRQPGKNHADNQTPPTPIKKRPNGAQVESDQPYRRWPADSLMTIDVGSFVVHHTSAFA